MKNEQIQIKKQQALEAYEEKQETIKNLLLQIDQGLLNHDRDASASGGHNWGHVGDLNRIVNELTDIRDRLMKTGEYMVVKKVSATR